MADRSRDSPRVIALVDLLDLQWQLKRIGLPSDPEPATVIEQLEAGLGNLDPALEVRPAFGTVYVYAPRVDEQPGRSERLAFKPRATAANSPCWSCTKACTHCQAGGTSSSGQGHDNPMYGDLMEFTREDAYDWAALVTTDLLLIPAIRYVQSRGRRIVHGCFPPLAIDLTNECWASIDLRVLNQGSEYLPDTAP